MSDKPSKQSMEAQVKAAWITAGGAVLGSVIAGIVALAIAGGKANEASGRPVNVVSNLRSGLALVNPSRPASDSFQLAKPSVVPTLPQTATATLGAKAQEEQPTLEMKAATCSGLGQNTWSVALAPVTPLKGKDNKGIDLTGYNVNLQLTNVGTRPLNVNYNAAELTDNEGNQFTVSTSSLPLNNPNFAPNEVDASAVLPVNLKFLGTGTLGKSVTFSVNLHISTKRDDLPSFQKVETLMCINQPVS